MKPPLFLVIYLFLSPAVMAAGAVTDRTVTAVRTDTPPVIDGHVDENEWYRASVSGSFIQNEPDDGEPATERTELRVLYDDAALYIAVICYDSEPDGIVRRLTRRDRRVSSDYVQIAIDSYNDRTTAFVFEVNAAGVKRDFIILNDGDGEDLSWDGLWDASVALRGDGWSTEFRIPWRTLRFASADEQIWGFNATRRIERKSEFSLWAHIPQGSRGIVSKFGRLRGMEGLQPPRSLLVVPYTVAGATRWPGDQVPRPATMLEPTLDAGADVQYGITNNTMLNLSINPDFGQVELDEVILNLSAFETFYSELRPFFIEGSSIFNTVGPLGGGFLRTYMFYSRRIGARPSRFGDIPDSVDADTWHLKSNPSVTPILGAVKLSSRSGNGWSGGLLNTTTGRTQSVFRGPAPNRETVTMETEPLSNYSVGRIRYDLANPGSYIGAVGTSVIRENGVAQAYSGGVDWIYTTRGYWFGSDGLAAMTYRNTPDGVKDGYHLQTRFFTEGHDNVRGMLGANIYSKYFDPNDIGFNTRNNLGIYYLWFQVRKDEPWGIVRRIMFNQFNYAANILDTGLNYVRGLEPYLSVTWMNYWYSELGGSFESHVNDPYESRGLGIFTRPPMNRVWFYSRTDNRRTLTFAVNTSYSRRDGSGTEYSWSLPLTVKAGSQTELTFTPTYRTSRGLLGWVSNQEDIVDDGIETSVFGRRNVDQINTTIRFIHSFNPDLTLQGYVQYFWARGEYYRFYALEGSGGLADLPVPYDRNLYDNPDFNRSNMNVNIILRYEYRPGSTLFVVWTHSRNESIDDHTVPAGRFFSRTMESPAMNILLLKWTYAIGL
jgi:hypothetical protein